ncbi:MULTISPECIES: rRNA maturation RNase YbeY [unclassified Enterococcus]|uniref:rRNA maturation RNase YbeY n=1 Tax=unclassified Enterococcus TaxID=2608891 RepID=UPI001552B7CF|nr:MULTISPECIES: rRNA maturation RNase YbeY [unclassified Enterococcus]MBS7577354.1 rRNA maturation RNase YbeY [Enterococcus sp. MMGLQ5-2]MBS7584761.1 rRNA maturation RNase YbeY [Enterococcus sp. MMGLQ5-1]NPD12616.1 rRNA maturation RNase YbeY [Enterococcus sp. MMGLQ5-1]NPD37188.1 rRNA maturation RNase YbeY [Enterococcus sp. MMGLQ5-2]
MEIELIDETGKVSATDQKSINNLLQYAANYLKLAPSKEMRVTFVDNTTIQKINFEYRAKDAPTDVVSLEYQPEAFDFSDLEIEAAELSALDDELNSYLGELFISVDKAHEQAESYGHSYERELGFLALHGFLHINGYDHMNQSDEEVMFGLQKEILNHYGLKRE